MEGSPRTVFRRCPRAHHWLWGSQQIHRDPPYPTRDGSSGALPDHSGPDGTRTRAADRLRLPRCVYSFRLSPTKRGYGRCSLLGFSIALSYRSAEFCTTDPNGVFFTGCGWFRLNVSASFSRRNAAPASHRSQLTFQAATAVCTSPGSTILVVFSPFSQCDGSVDADQFAAGTPVQSHSMMYGESCTRSQTLPAWRNTASLPHFLQTMFHRVTIPHRSFHDLLRV